jgi:hypothetical protein
MTLHHFKRSGSRRIIGNYESVRVNSKRSWPISKRRPCVRLQDLTQIAEPLRGGQASPPRFKPVTFDMQEVLPPETK